MILTMLLVYHFDPIKYAHEGKNCVMYCSSNNIRNMFFTLSIECIIPDGILKQLYFWASTRRHR